MRNLDRRSFLAASGGALAALAAEGCSREVTQVAGSVPRRYAKRLHIVFWHSFADVLGDAMHRLIDEFNESQDDIYVEGQFQGSYEESQQKVAAALVANQVPDVMIYSEVTWRKLHLAGKLEPLDGYFGDGFTPDAYIDQFIVEGTVQDTLWWVPFARSTPMFYYNRDVFEKAGLPDRGPATWSELLEWAPAIQGVRTPNGRPRAHAFAATYASWYFQGTVWQWGGRYSDGLKILLDEERPKAAGRWMVDFIRKERSAYLAQNNLIDFANQVAATTMLSTANLTNVLEQSKFAVGTSFLPEQEHFGCPTGGSGLAIMKDAPKERKQAAFEFIRFLAQPEKSAQWTMETGYLPVVKAAQQVPALRRRMREEPNSRTALEQLPKTRPQDLLRTVVPNAGVMLDVALQRLYSSNASVDEEFDLLADRFRSRAALIEETYELRYG